MAKDPTCALADELGIEVDWRPLTLDIPSFLGSARLDDKGRVAEQDRTPQQWTGVRYAYRDARRYAERQGYTLRGTVKIWDTSLVHIGLMWAKRQGPDVLKRYLDLVYERFWRREFDADDPAVVRGALEESGAQTEDFESFRNGEGRAEHDAMQGFNPTGSHGFFQESGFRKEANIKIPIFHRTMASHAGRFILY